jgi:hypothetical protein
VGGRFDGLAAPADRLADLKLDFSVGGYAGREKRTILYMGTEPYDNATVPRIMLMV